MWLAIRSFGSSYRHQVRLLARGFWMTSHNNKVVFDTDAKLQSSFGQTRIPRIHFSHSFTRENRRKQSWLIYDFRNRNGWEKSCQNLFGVYVRNPRFPTKIDSLLDVKFKDWNYTKKSWSQNEEIPECKYKVTLHKKAVRGQTIYETVGSSNGGS